MSISEQAKSVIERPLDRSRIKSRQGGQGMSFDYIGTEHAIQLLNEAFDYSWDSRVVEHFITDDGNLAIALVEVKVWDDSGSPVIKQQFGSCNINRGVDPGSALKGAVSDGLKKCASLLGVALELYLDDVPASFVAPAKPAAAPPRPAPPATPGRAAAAAPAPPKPPAAPPKPPAPPVARPAPPAPPTHRPNPFTGQGGGNTASVPKPPAPVAAPPVPPSRPAPPAAVPAPPPVAASAVATPPPRPNPFGGDDAKKGITSVQLNALTSLAQKKGVNQPDLIALAGVVDGMGAPKQTFDELTHAEAIEVVKSAQR